MNESPLPFIIITLSMAVLLSALSISVTQDYYHNEAVKHKAAHWEAGASGAAEWKWNQ